MKLLKFILAHVKAGTIDEVFNESTFDRRLNAYRLKGLGITVSKEMLDDIKSNPAHYERIIFEEEKAAPPSGE